MQLSCTEGDGERKAGGESRDKLELVLISAVSGPCTAALGRGDTVIALCSVPAIVKRDDVNPAATNGLDGGHD